MQKIIKRMPRSSKNLANRVASFSVLCLPNEGSISSTRGVSQTRRSFLPAGAPSLVTSSTLWNYSQIKLNIKTVARCQTSRPNIFFMWTPGSLIVALQETNRIRLSRNHEYSKSLQNDMIDLLPIAAQIRRNRLMMYATWLSTNQIGCCVAV